MARARNIKPGLFKNELLGVSDPLLTILFESLWCLADKSGRLEDRPLRIKAETFPYREGLNINGYLTELERMGFIFRYVVDGMPLIQVVNFLKHQNPHKTEKASDLPEMPIKSNGCDLTVKEPLKTGSRPADSLIPDSLIPDSLIPDSGYQIPDITKHKKASASPVDELVEKFDEVWHAYPKRPGASKADSMKAWKARVKAGSSVDDILAGVLRYAAYVAASGTEPQFIKQPQTFFGPGEHYLADWTISHPSARASPARESRHSGFDKIDYSEGVIDGRIG